MSGIREKILKTTFNKVNYKELSLIAGNLAHLYKDAIKINYAIELITEITLNKEYKNSLIKVVSFIEEGDSLSQAFGKMPDLYPNFFVGIISIGENSGKLYEVLNALENYYRKRVLIKNEIISAIAYPIFILVSIITLIIFMISVVIPNFYDIYLSIGTTPPISCSLLYNASVYLKNNITFTIISILCWFIFIPIIVVKNVCMNKNLSIFKNLNIFKSFFEYIMIFILSIIINSGVNISYGLNYCSNGLNLQYLSKKINDINKSILNGCSLTEALYNSQMFSKYTIAIVKIREESGTVGDGLKELSSSLEQTLSKKIKRYISFLQPTLIIFMASLILIFLNVFILPLFDALKVGIR